MDDDVRHLTESEFLDILEATVPVEANDRATAHLRVCAACRQRLQHARSVDAALGSLVISATLGPGDGCAPAEIVGKLAAGVAEEAEAKRWLSHIAECDACGARLRAATDDLMRGLTKEEEDLVASIPAVQSGAAPALAARLRRNVRRPFWEPWAIAAAALVVIGSLLGWQVLRRNRIHSVEAQLRIAYTSERPFDYRLPDNGHSPVAVTRGSAGSNRELLKAQGELADPPPYAAAEPIWLRLRGESDLLRGDPQAAVESLGRARDLAPQDADTAVDLAVAYAIRGDMNQHPLDYAPALELLSLVLRDHPGHNRAIFNRALLFERQRLYQQAADDWRRYLAADPAGDWAAEARRRLQAVEQHLQKRARHLRRFRGGASALLDALQHREPLSLDLYYDIAFLDWLAKPTLTGDTALRAAAARLHEDNQDRWLRDLIQQAPAGHPVYAQLAALAALNHSGDASSVIDLANRVLPSLRPVPAAWLRGRFELVYAFHRAARPIDCRSEAQRLAADLRLLPYPWLAVENQLELGVCNAMLGEEVHGLEILSAAESVASRHQLASAALRAHGLRVSIQTNSGDPWTVWQEFPALVGPYWDDAFPGNRLHQAAFTLSDSAEALAYPSTAYLTGKIAVDAIAETTNLSTEALGHAYLSGRAQKAGLDAETLVELDRADTIFSHLPSSQTVTAYLMNASLARAEAQLSKQDAHAALTTLTTRFPLNVEAPTFLMNVRRHQLLADSYLQIGLNANAAAQVDGAFELIRARMASRHSGAERVRVFESVAESYRTAATLDMRNGRPEKALDRILELYTARSGAGLSAPAGFRRETLLVSSVLDRSVVLWARENGHVRSWHLTESPAHLRAQAAQLVHLVSSPRSELGAVRDAGRALADMLLTPSGIDFQAGRTVTIVADGETGRVPFALLVLSDGHFLGETVPLVNVRYGAAGGAAHHIGASTPVLLAANAHAYSNGISLPPLPDAEREVAALGERFTAPTVLRGGDLTADRLEAEAPRAALFHFAGHGVAPAGNGALIMAGGAPALLTAARVARMDWSRCALVALATCLSAAGELDGIANPESLVRAFLTAGAQSVLASGWQVDSAAASDFFNAFYRSLLGGAPVEQAAFFAGAQLRSNPRYRHPRYWAAFQLYE